MEHNPKVAEFQDLQILCCHFGQPQIWIFKVRSLDVRVCFSMRMYMGIHIHIHMYIRLRCYINEMHTACIPHNLEAKPLQQTSKPSIPRTFGLAVQGVASTFFSMSPLLVIPAGFS